MAYKSGVGWGNSDAQYNDTKHNDTLHEGIQHNSK